MQWDVFSVIHGNVARPLLAAMDALALACQAWVGPNLKNGLLLYFTGRLAIAALRRDVRPLVEWEYAAVAGAMALYMASSATGYATFVRSVVIDGLGRDLAGALSGRSGIPVTAGAFDGLWGRAWASGVAVYRNIHWSVSGMGPALGLSLLVVFYWIAALLATGLGFFLWMFADVATALLVGVGPLFVGLWLFPLTRPLFWGWFGCTMASVVLKLLLIAMVGIAIGAMTVVLGMVAGVAQRASAGANELAPIQTLLGSLVLFLTFGGITTQIPGIASTIGGGFAGFGTGAGGGGSAAAPQDAMGDGGGAQPPQAPQPSQPPALSGGGVPRHQPPGRSLSD